MQQAPQAALDYLEANPDTAHFFKDKYGYLPAPPKALEYLEANSSRFIATITSVAPSKAYCTALVPTISASAPSILDIQEIMDLCIVPGFSYLTLTFN